MAVIPVRCPSCDGNAVVKRGKTDRGKQRYLCQNEACAYRTFLLDYTNRGYMPSVKRQIIDLTMNGSGIRDTAGFDAVTGALTRIDIRGEGGQSFKDKWAEGPRTYLGIQTAGFPNFFIANSAAFCNFPRCAEMIVEWIAECIGYMCKKDLKRIVPTPQAEEAWVEHANELTAGTLFAKGNSWFVGANIPDKKRVFLLYANTALAYRQKCAGVAANGYEGFLLQ